MRRRLDAALLLDKPSGVSSNAALQRARKLYRAEKAGHAGTLDPLASGLLLVLFGDATKFAGPMLDADKEYLATVKLGERTSTGDAEGEVLEKKAIPPETETSIHSVVRGFLGEIEQVPPMYSALKKDGVPLYKLARKGEEVERAARRVTISRLDIVKLELPLLELRVRCSKGTYIRTLAEDIGAKLGTGAHLAGLRRTGSGSFSLDSATGLDALEAMSEGEREGKLLGLRALLAGLPEVALDPAAEARFRNGQSVPFTGPAAALCAVYGAGGAVLGLGSADGAGSVRPLRLVAMSQAAEIPRKTL